ncbi:MAG TPA: M23 family metallopeptidase, partial [Actinomycetota bacterium]|nr:M23 family metallopeptidase [Actinomycetota bacterium]
PAATETRDDEAGVSTASPATAPASPVVAAPTRAPSPSPVQTVSSADDQAARALLDELGELLPGATLSGDTPMDRLAVAIEAVRVRLAEVERRLARWLAEEKLSAERLAAAEQAVLDAGAAVAEAEEAVREQAGDFYMAPAWSEAIVFAAGNLEDAGRARGYMTALLGDRVDVVHALRTAQVRLETERDAVHAASAALSKAGERIRAEHAVLNALTLKMRALLDEVVRSYGAGSAEFARIIGEAQRGQSPAAVLERFVFAPVEGPVTSPFGPRIHPIYGYRSLHTGTDIAATEGTALLAPRDGTVLAAGPAGPFGLSVVIDHGGRIATVLSHLSLVSVAPGDVVRSGDVVGFAGCTGWCTGPHLHFEVWFDGRALDPADWMIERPLPGPLVVVRGEDEGRLEPPEPPEPPEPAGAGTLTGLRNPFEDSAARS